MSRNSTDIPTAPAELAALESAYSDGEFLRTVQHKAAAVVAFSLSRVFYADTGRNNVRKYAKTIGAGLREIWHTYVLKALEDRGLHLTVPLGVLYVNTLGIRFKILSESLQDRKYDLRAAAYLGPCFADPAEQDKEDTRNWQVFHPEKSSHLLKLACDGVSNLPFALAFEDAAVSLPPDRVIAVPMCPVDDDSRRFFGTDDVEGIDAGRLVDGFRWMAPAQLAQIVERIRNVLGLPGSYPLDQEKALRAVFNLYRLCLRDSHRRTLEALGFPQGIRQLFYLPEVVTPNLTPGGFAGFISIPAGLSPQEGLRFLHTLQAMFARAFTQAVEAAEAVGLRVTVQGGLKSEQSWAGKYLSDKASPDRPPLLADLVEAARALRTVANPDPFQVAAAAMIDVVEESFIRKVQPIPEAHAGQEAVQTTVEQVANDPPRTAAELATFLQTPVLGYRAISQASYDTFQRLWMSSGVLTDVNKGYNDTLLGFLSELQDQEPSLHMLSGYRDHFVHSLHVFILGLWFLSCRRTRGGPYLLFDDCRGEQRLGLLKQWLMAASLHDVAYPVQKLEDGSLDLFRRYSTFSQVHLHNEHIQFYADFGGCLNEAALANFFHERIQEAIAEMPDGRQSRPLFRRLNGVVSSGALATWLVHRFAHDSEHGVWAAFLLHNHFFNAEGQIRKEQNRTLYSLSSRELTEVCVAIAFHHFYERYIPSLMTDDYKQSLWYVEPGHPMLYLLVLCDTLAQWGRTRETAEPGTWSYRDRTLDEKRRDVRLANVAFDAHGMQILLEQHYPEFDKNVVTSCSDYTEVPLRLLGSDDGRVLMNVRVAWQGWKGPGEEASALTCQVRGPRTRERRGARGRT